VTTATAEPRLLEPWEEQSHTNAVWVRETLTTSPTLLRFLRHRPRPELLLLWQAALREGGVTLEHDPEADSALASQALDVAFLDLRTARSQRVARGDDTSDLDTLADWLNVASVARDASMVATQDRRYADCPPGYTSVDLPVPEVATPVGIPDRDSVVRRKAADLAEAVGRAYDRHAPETISIEASARGVALCPTCITLDEQTRMPKHVEAPCDTLLDLTR